MKNKFNAFTLAEVLITLGIIGVVAALTLPALIQNYQKKTWIEGLKVGVSMLQQGFRQAMAADGVDDIRNTTFFEKCSIRDDEAYNSSDWRNRCKPELEKYFKGLKFESVPDQIALGDNTNIITDPNTCKKLVGKTNKWYYLNDRSKCRGWKNIAVTLANGMRADILFEDSGFCAGQITALDINGGKGPNTWGRDVFTLLILPDGRLVGMFSRAHAEAYAKYNKRDFQTLYNDSLQNVKSGCNKSTTEEGTDCSGRVIDEGWVMNY